jgi:RNA-directed DNA polymerase
MDEYGKSDRSVVPVKPPNKTAVAEVVEERGLVKGNAASATRPGLRAGHDATSALERVRRERQQTRKHGSPRYYTMSPLIGCGQPIGR